jgi:sec-independent protein translocase protein TatA
MGTLSPIHWVLVAIVVLLVFGPKTLAKVGRNVGKGVRSVNSLKQGLTGDPLKILTEPLPPKQRAPVEPPKPKESPAEVAAESPPTDPAKVAATEPAGASEKS